MDTNSPPQIKKKKTIIIIKTKIKIMIKSYGKIIHSKRKH